MRTNIYSTFELAEIMLFLRLDLVLVRVRPLYAVFESLNTEFLLTRQQMMDSIEKQSLNVDSTLYNFERFKPRETQDTKRWN
jgi:hypothetical protein